MELGFCHGRHADRYLKPPTEMQRLFSRYPEALARTLEIAERCRFGRRTGLPGATAATSRLRPGSTSPCFGQGMTGDTERGGQVAERWCASCHLVSDRQERATTDAATFRGIAERSPEAIDALTAFLMDPHPPMPDLSLTREEIRDLLAYITSLR